MSSLSPVVSLTVTGALLKVVFSVDVLPSLQRFPHEITPIQYRALKAISQHGAWKVGRGYFANYGNLIAAHGLPGTPELFQEFVGAVEALLHP